MKMKKMKLKKMEKLVFKIILFNNLFIINRLVTSFIGYLTKNKPKFYGIPLITNNVKIFI